MSEPFVIAEDLGVELPDGRPLFDHLSMSVGEGRTALVGANGVGKSVLLDVLVGIRVPERGRVIRRGRIAYVAQRRSATPESPDETVAARLGVAHRLEALARVLAGGSDPADYERVGVDGWDLEERTRAALDRVGLQPLGLEARMADLSGGEAARVTLVGALLAEPDLLVLDEPTNDLDADSKSHLLALLEGWRGGVLAVSHDRGFLRRVDRILELGPGGLREFGGAWDAWREARSRELDTAEAALASARAARRKAASDAAQARERQERRTARGVRTRSDGSQPKTVLNARRARSQASSARLDRVQSDGVMDASTRVSEAAARVHRAAAPRVEIGSSGLPAGREVLLADGLSWTPPGRDRALFEDLSLIVRGPERLAVEGPNGSGKSTLLALLAGRRDPDRGSVRRGLPDDRIAWLDQQTRTLDHHDTVLSSFRAAHPAMEESWARHTLARFLFLDDAVHTPIAALSGGERVRAALAGLLGGERTPQLLFLDEPTNHLDLPGLEAVEAALAEWDGALVVVSHDADFVDAIGVERRIVLGRTD